jgi:signal peptidase I
MPTKNKPPAPKPKATGEHVVQPPHQVKDGFRETVESIAIAFVLAFLFRTFEAEAFVIPTGSMAPTLLGQHKDVNCIRCEYPFRVSASDDDDAPKEVIGCTCPNCRYQINFEPAGPDGPIPPTYKGDRIIVAKFPYEVGDPHRWDVAVFRYPLTAKTNFIKRIVGLPRETLQIFHGDILTRPEGGVDFKIQRKPPDKVQAMLQEVYNNDYVLPSMVEKGWPLRWQPAGVGPAAEAWKSTDEYKSYAADGKAAESWLRYQHTVPSEENWEWLLRGPLTPAEKSGVRPQLITDFSAYNTAVDIGRHDLEEARKSPSRLYLNDRARYDSGLHWVGDLAVECELKVLGSEGEVVLELVEGGRAFRCRLDLKSGLATLSGQDAENFHPQAHTSVRGPGTYRLQFANVDDQLLLWVDGKLIEFDGTTAYELPWHPPTQADLSPAAIASRKAQVEVHHLRLSRDIYYIADSYRLSAYGAISDYDGNNALAAFADGSWMQHFPKLRSVEFTLEANQFLALGDNSSRSKDSRLWPPDPNPPHNPRYFVQRDLLIGKAVFIYWPHALDHIPGTSIWFPLFPNFERMKFIR